MCIYPIILVRFQKWVDVQWSIHIYRYFNRNAFYIEVLLAPYTIFHISYISSLFSLVVVLISSMLLILQFLNLSHATFFDHLRIWVIKLSTWSHQVITPKLLQHHLSAPILRSLECLISFVINFFVSLRGDARGESE